MTEELKEEYAEKLKKVHTALSEGRKAGHDMLIAQLKFHMLRPTIQMALATLEPKQIAKTNQLFTEVWKEIHAITGETLKSAPSIKQLQAYITQAQSSLQHGDPKTARTLYGEVQAHFKNLSLADKQVILPMAQKLLKKLK